MRVSLQVGSPGVRCDAEQDCEEESWLYLDSQGRQLNCLMGGSDQLFLVRSFKSEPWVMFLCFLPFRGGHALFSGLLTYWGNSYIPARWWNIGLWALRKYFYTPIFILVKLNLSFLFNLFNFHVLIHFFTVFQLIVVLLWNLSSHM